MEAVNAFNNELFSLMDSKPPISRAKMVSITKSAIKAMKLYKHVVQIVEKFVKKCKPEYKVAGLYVVDSIVRQSRHQFGADKDVFGPRFTKNINGTFENLCLCPLEDRSKLVRVLNLWQKNGVFKIEVIQPLLDKATGSGGGTSSYPSLDEPVSPPSPAKEPVGAATENSTKAAVPPLPNSDAFAAVAQLFQSSEGQQILQNFQQQPLKPQPETRTQPAPLQPQLQAQPHIQPHLQAHLQAQPQPHLQAQPQPHLQAQSQPHLQAQPSHSPTSRPSHNLTSSPTSRPSHSPSSRPKTWLPVWAWVRRMPPLSTQTAQQKAAFDMTLLDRFDYDDEPEAAEENKKEEALSSQPSILQQPPGFHQNMDRFSSQMMGMIQDPSQQGQLPNGQLLGYGLPPGRLYPGTMPPMGQAQPGPPMPGSAGAPGFPGAYPSHNAVQQDMDVERSGFREGRHGRRSHSGSRSPKRRRSRSNSRTRRPRHRHSRSRESRHHSPRSRSQERQEREREKERQERERERERRQKGLPQLLADTLSVCSTTLWVGQLDKRTQQQDVACMLEEFGPIDSINMIPPRGCAYIVMVERQDAFRALQKLGRGHKVNQKVIKIAWALNKGIKPDLKQYWDVELGVTYIPWSKITEDQLEEIQEGGMLDLETLSPEWKGVTSGLEQQEELPHNGRSEPPQSEETPGPPGHPQQGPPGQLPMVGPGSLQPPGFPGPMGMPPPSFPPGVPPPPFIRPGFNRLPMPTGAMPLCPPPPGQGAVENPSLDPAGLAVRNGDERPEGPHPFNNQMGPMGTRLSGPPGNLPPIGGLLGARPGIIPLQRPPGLPPPHMQRFPPPHGPRPPHPNMPPMPPQMLPRGPRPPMMRHELPPPLPGGFGMLPPHIMRGPFPPHGPPPPGLPPPPPFGPQQGRHLGPNNQMTGPSGEAGLGSESRRPTENGTGSETGRGIGASEEAGVRLTEAEGQTGKGWTGGNVSAAGKKTEATLGEEAGTGIVRGNGTEIEKEIGTEIEKEIGTGNGTGIGIGPGIRRETGIGRGTETERGRTGEKGEAARRPTGTAEGVMTESGNEGGAKEEKGGGVKEEEGGGEKERGEEQKVKTGTGQGGPSEGKEVRAGTTTIGSRSLKIWTASVPLRAQNRLLLKPWKSLRNPARTRLENPLNKRQNQNLVLLLFLFLSLQTLLKVTAHRPHRSRMWT
ncbi:Splicing factor, arginine/serine-rich 15 [Merluccius polli]|uniref:Splicing factor, arginine/serine-rich 15 n=1 Tax=Merluccius polli TaxID=89951 RepID=A0AA47N3U8_MERPO|nr:Splicing factor, arginine/serine-rich 15 [Merluccius polli]